MDVVAPQHLSERQGVLSASWTVGSRLHGRAKLGQSVQQRQAMAAYKKILQMRSNSPLPDFIGVSVGAGLDFCLYSWEKYIIYWDYITNHLNVILYQIF